eukprot:4068554-Amphidinium_carterae.1
MSPRTPDDKDLGHGVEVSQSHSTCTVFRSGSPATSSTANLMKASEGYCEPSFRKRTHPSEKEEVSKSAELARML